MAKMKAEYRAKYGTPDSLHIFELDRPEPSEDEILVKVFSTTVNRTDYAVLTGKPLIMRCFIGLKSPKRKVTGTDFAGVIIKMGGKVTKFNIGDRILGFNDEGLSTQGEYASINIKEAIVAIPEGINYTTAVACAEGAHYAYNFLNKVDIKTGSKVLVNGATGAIGSAAIQLLLAKGAIITAVCNTKNIEKIKALGVDKIIDYEVEDFTKSEDKFDFVLDAVGKSRFKYCRRILKKGGIYVSSELGPNAENLRLALTTLFTSKFGNKQRVVFPFPYAPQKSLNHVVGLLKQSKFNPLIDRIYPLKDIAEAYKYVNTGMKTGNVIIKYHE